MVPIMGALRLRRRVNHLTAEALAVAKLSDGGIRVTAEAPLLRERCAELGIRLEVLSPFVWGGFRRPLIRPLAAAE
jgi:hypothetical protein